MLLGSILVIMKLARHRPRNPGRVECPGLGSRLAACLIAAWACLTLAPLAAQAAEQTYILGPGDQLRIAVYEEPELSGDFEVDSSGSISLPLIGEVATRGLNPRSLEMKIIEQLGDGYLVNPKVTVKVLEYRPFYILGGVQAPGSYPYVSGITVLNAVALAGGYTGSSDDNRRLQIEVTGAHEELDLLLGNYWVAIAVEARLIAAREERKSIRFPDKLLQHKDDPKMADIVDGQTRIFNARRRTFVGEIAILNQQKAQYHEEIAALNAKLQSSLDQLELVNSEIVDIEKLLAKGFARKTRLTALQRTAAQIEGGHQQDLAAIARARQNIGGVDLRIIERRNQRLNDIARDLQVVQKEVAELERRVRAANDVLRQTEANLGQAGVGQTAEQDTRLMITRESAAGPREIEAAESTVVFPGDIIRVPGIQSTAAYPSPIGDQIPGTQATD
jgi:protein involved in polysaccharide export with SLBB domain